MAQQVKKQKVNPAPPETARLPAGVVAPRFYDLRLAVTTPANADWSFTGTSTVRLAVLDAAATSFVCHARSARVHITSVEVVGEGGGRVGSVSEANSEDQVEISFGAPLSKFARAYHEFATPAAPGADVQLETAKKNSEKWIEISFSFQGPIVENALEGLYKFYHTVDGKKETGLTTFFEPVAARCVFPCWDEPAAKAVFQVSFTGPADWTVLNNTDAESSEPGDGAHAGQTTTRFAPTPLMSTYLLALVAGKLQYAERTAKSGVRVRTYAPQGSPAGKLVMATEVAADSLNYYESHFDVPYPLNKLDQMALPAFAMGAEEQWGLITYIDTSLLIDESGSLASKRRLQEIVHHEIAHQWFGNLVTLSWWDELWLKEALATVLSFMVMDNYRPDYHAWENFIPRTEMGMGVDQLASTRTVNIDIHSIKDIGESFDYITYCKGGTLMLMLLNFVGDDAVQKGLSLYLKRHAYGCTIGTDMYEALSEACGIDVKSLMFAWINAPGFPEIEVVNWPADAAGRVALRQTRFGGAAGDQQKTVWNVPIRWAKEVAGNADNTTDVLLMKSRDAALEGCQDASLLLLNVGRPGFYRVRYPPALLNALGQLMTKPQGEQHAHLQTAARDRFGLLSDLSAGVIAGRSPVTSLLELALNYGNERDPDTMRAASEALGHCLRCVASDSTAQQAITARIVAMLEPAARRLGWAAPAGSASAEPVSDTVLRAVVHSALGNADHEPTVASALAAFRGDPSLAGLDSEMRPTCWNIVGRHGSADDHALLRAELARNASVDPVNVVTLCGALARPKDMAIYQANLDWAVAADSPVPRHNARSLVFGTSGPAGQATAWAWVVREYDSGWLSSLPGNHRLNVLRFGFKYAPALLDEIHAFMTVKERNADFRKGYAQLHENLVLYKAFIAREQASLIAHLK